MLIAGTLQRLTAPTRGEVAASRAAWPALAAGLPASPTSALARAATAAERGANALALPAFVTTEGSLTGPAAKLAGMLKGYTRLVQRGWQITAATLASGSSAGATQFLRANSALYIYCIYDGHYDLSLIGKALQGAYHTLGGASAFGRSLAQGQVEALARDYSIPSSRLTPHPPASLAL